MEAESFTTASVDGAQIVCRVIGKGPPLVVLNGFGVASADGGPSFIDRLASSNELILLNNRGIGGSADDGQPFEIAKLADDTARVIETLGIDHAANLKIAADYPANMKRAREFSCSRAVALFLRIHPAHPRCRRQHQMRLNRLRQRLTRPGFPAFADRFCVAFHVHFLQPFHAVSHNIFRFLPGRFEQRP